MGELVSVEGRRDSGTTGWESPEIDVMGGRGLGMALGMGLE